MERDLVLNGFRVPSDGTKLDPDKFYEIIERKRAEGMNLVGIWAANTDCKPTDKSKFETKFTNSKRLSH